eukprot:7142-Pleurochrysis_carterae.AAC.1
MAPWHRYRQRRVEIASRLARLLPRGAGCLRLCRRLQRGRRDDAEALTNPRLRKKVPSPPSERSRTSEMPAEIGVVIEIVVGIEPVIEAAMQIAIEVEIDARSRGPRGGSLALLTNTRPAAVSVIAPEACSE